MIRIAVNTLLVVILASCPLWCATSGPCCDVSAADHDPGPHDAIPTSANDDHCICAGAMVDSPCDLPPAAMTDGPLVVPVVLFLVFEPALLPDEPIRPPGSDPPGASVSRRLALLAVYRC